MIEWLARINLHVAASLGVLAFGIVAWIIINISSLKRSHV